MEFWNSELLKKDIILQNKQDLNAKLEQEIQQIKKKAPKLLNEQLQRSSDAHQNEIAKIHAVFEELKSESLRKNFQEIEVCIFLYYFNQKQIKLNFSNFFLITDFEGKFM